MLLVYYNSINYTILQVELLLKTPISVVLCFLLFFTGEDIRLE